MRGIGSLWSWSTCLMSGPRLAMARPMFDRIDGHLPQQAQVHAEAVAAAAAELVLDDRVGGQLVAEVLHPEAHADVAADPDAVGGADGEHVRAEGALGHAALVGGLLLTHVQVVDGKTQCAVLTHGHGVPAPVQADVVGQAFGQARLHDVDVMVLRTLRQEGQAAGVPPHGGHVLGQGRPGLAEGVVATTDGEAQVDGPGAGPGKGLAGQPHHEDRAQHGHNQIPLHL